VIQVPPDLAFFRRQPFFKLGWFSNNSWPLRHAEALQELCMVQSGLKDFVAASESRLTSWRTERYKQCGSGLLVLGLLDRDQG
jgi:hypothetical protein